MSRFHASINTVVMLDDSSGTTRDISKYVNSIDAPTNTDSTEVTGFGESHKSYVLGASDEPVTINGFYDDTATTGSHAVLSGLIGGTAGYTLAFYPKGTASGNPVFSGEVLMTAYSLSSSTGGAITFSASFVSANSSGLSWSTV